ncbi:MAG: AMP-binding protein, partial [bacterium]|nr:AMP-binding protein [bacterium]
TRVYIVDKNTRPVPIGIPGELCIAGDGVALGYLDRPELTAEKFNRIEVKLKQHRKEKQRALNTAHSTYDRIYRTGDRAAWRPDGNIQFMGRIDQQVKIRGYRIELKEIENRVSAHKAVTEAVVVAATEGAGEKYLCAYYVPAAGSGPELTTDIIQTLEKELPAYMIPVHFVPLETIPVTPNGKLDVRALPGPKITAPGTVTAPTDDLEKTLAAIWTTVLFANEDAPLIGIDDDFFRIGGHSLKATVLITKIQKELNVKITLGEIFKTTTIRGQAAYIKKAVKEKYNTIEPGEKKEYYPASSAQKRLYILQQMEPETTGYNMPAIMQLEGELQKNRMEEAFLKLIHRHESLCTYFETIEGETVQKVYQPHEVPFKIQYYKAGHEELETVVNRFIRSFTLSVAPLIRVGLIEESAGKNRTGQGPETNILMLDMHHTIADGISRRILAKEFLDYYAGKELAPLRLQYKDYTRWQRGEKQQNAVKKQEEYWLKQYEGQIPVLDLPTDYPRPVIQTFEGKESPFKIDKGETVALKKLANEQGTTLFMVLLTLFNICLSKLSGQEDIIVGTVTAGRRHSELGGIVGMFVNTLAIRNHQASDSTTGEFLDKIKETTLGAFENQDYQFEELVDKLNINRDLSRNALFDVAILLQNMELAKIEIPGMKLRPLKYENKISKFDLMLLGMESGEELELKFEYSTKLFKETTINRYINYFKNLTSAMTGNPGKKINQIEILSREEKQRLLIEFNKTAEEYPKDKTIYELFQEQAEKRPDAIAVTAMPKALTYSRLNQKATQIAAALSRKGIKPETVVAIKVE